MGGVYEGEKCNRFKTRSRPHLWSSSVQIQRFCYPSAGCSQCLYFHAHPVRAHAQSVCYIWPLNFVPLGGCSVIWHGKWNPRTITLAMTWSRVCTPNVVSCFTDNLNSYILGINIHLIASLQQLHHEQTLERTRESYIILIIRSYISCSIFVITSSKYGCCY